MKAATYHGRRDVRIEEVAEPTLGPNDVHIEVETCGICGSDLHEYVAGPIFVPGEEPHPVTGEAMPITMGHEFGGVITDIGAEVTSHDVGEAVAVNPIVWCGECRYCDEGKYHLCESVGFVGLSGGGGGFSETVTVPAVQAVPLGDVPVEYGALAEPFSVALHAVHRSGLRAGDSVAVFGSGPIGLAVVQAARAAGAGRILVSEPREARRELASESGADHLIDPTETDPVDRVVAETGGGADVAFEVAGIETTFRQGLESAKADGTLTVVSIFEEEISMHPNAVVLGERTITGTLAYLGGPLSAREFGAVIDMFENGDLDPEAIVTARIDLPDLVDEGFERLLDDESEQVKILVEP
ncbi:2,3-butanediol dehydrogenase [Halegenticoccus tardaugens]|uniref:2,3-butanediol dehydrogenase n=1 Tax=Halegenticoccus tardaugens TaxID=2071624 RepID=UPI00100AEA3F|nr:2,3-butanediol dehydrogenase [Halegenticoccus tardaugens]